MRVLALVLPAVLIVAAGCDRGHAESLQARAATYWELRQAKRWEQVYDECLDPSLRSDMFRQKFLQRRRLAYDVLSYSIGEVREDGDKGTVIASMEANFPIPIPLPSPIGQVRLERKTVPVEDEWVKRDGRWYIRLEK